MILALILLAGLLPDTDPRTETAQALHKDGAYAQAESLYKTRIRELEKVPEGDRNKALIGRLYWMLGHAQALQSKFADCEESYLRSIELDSHDLPGAYQNLTFCLNAQHKWAGTLVVLAHAEIDKATSPALYHNAAIAYERLGWPEKAKDLEKKYR